MFCFDYVYYLAAAPGSRSSELDSLYEQRLIGRYLFMLAACTDPEALDDGPRVSDAEAQGE
jgi:hypothetical protein